MKIVWLLAVIFYSLKVIEGMPLKYTPTEVCEISTTGCRCYYSTVEEENGQEATTK